MIKMHGVSSWLDGTDASYFKQKVLFFDQIYLAELRTTKPDLSSFCSECQSDIEYLQSENVIARSPTEPLDGIYRNPWEKPVEKPKEIGRLPIDDYVDIDPEAKRIKTAILELRDTVDDRLIRSWAGALAKNQSATFTPIIRNRIPVVLNRTPMTPTATNVLGIALQEFPVPALDCPWEAIIEFRKENADKLWELRRFLRKLATSKQTDAEIGEEIEWSLHEYEKAMSLHEMKSTRTFIDVAIISPLELIEDLAHIRLSKIARNFLSLDKRKIELLEAEMKAPGRECAYIFKAQEQFG
jgi:hypothetical protein